MNWACDFLRKSLSDGNGRRQRFGIASIQRMPTVRFSVGGIAAAVTALKLAGVDSYRESSRVIPGGDLARSVVGRTDTDGKGTAGLEQQYDSLQLQVPIAETSELLDDGKVPTGDQIAAQVERFLAEMGERESGEDSA